MAGNLDLNGFVTPEQNYGGLYKLSDTLQKNNYLKQAEADRQERLANQAEAKRNATATYLQGYLNPKHFLTGTNYDPVITTGVSGILQKAMSLASQGIDAPTITMAINPDVADLSKASQNIQAIDAQRDESVKNLSKIKGIDPDKYNQAFRDAAFYTTDANGKKTLNDMSTLDANKDIATGVLNNGDIYTNEGISDYLKNSKPTTVDFNNRVRDANGTVHQVKGTQTSPSFMISDQDANGVHQGFVPKYETATEGDAALLHTFKDDTGNEVKAPVRMVTDDIWQNLPSAGKGYIMQEVRGLIKDHPEIKLSSPQAEHLGKAILYDELKNSPDNYSTFKRTDVNLQPLPPRITINNGSANQQPKTIDLYNGDENNVGLNQVVDAAIQKSKSINPKAIPYTRFNEVPQQVQSTLIKQARDLSGDKGLNNANLYFYKDADTGDINLYQITGEHPNLKNDTQIMTVDPLTLNVPANTNVAKVGTGKTKPETINKVIETGKHPTNGGLSDDAYKEFLKKNNLSQ